MTVSTSAGRRADLLGHPGKVRGLQRVTSSDGYFLICALDHLSDFAELLAPDPASVSYSDVVQAKDLVVRTVAPSVSAVLLDARYGIPQLVASGAVPGSVGLMASVEDEDYTFPPGPRRTRYRAGWSPRQIKLAGADVAKLLWFYRPDLDERVAEQQRQLLRDLYAECTELSLPLVVEPIWYPVDTEDAASPNWRQRRYDGIVASAIEAVHLGLDMLKIEFPGQIDTEEGRAAAAEACQRIDDDVDVPWVLLSAGVSYADFTTQLRIACEAGGSGYLAGRSVWRDAVATPDPGRRAEGIGQARKRIDELNAITREYGRPFLPSWPLDEVVTAVPEDWYLSWHTPGDTRTQPMEPA